MKDEEEVKMSEQRDQNCNECSEECEEKDKVKTDFSAQPHEMSEIKKVIGVISGKGGVGKSLVTSLMAVLMKRAGYRTAILDADVTGPSIPKAFGLNEKAKGSDLGMFPVRSKTGIDIMSINLLLENDTDPVIWRGPIIGNTVKQFWTDVIWSDVDFMFLDMPPGTGDVPLTVFQSIAVDAIIVVTSPQELVSMIVSKSVKMAKMMNVPILGIVENMSYVNAEAEVLGFDHGQVGAKIIEKWNLPPELGEAIEFHHRPFEALMNIELVSIVHVSDGLVMMMGLHDGIDTLGHEFFSDAVKILNLDEEKLNKIMVDVEQIVADENIFM